MGRLPQKGDRSKNSRCLGPSNLGAGASARSQGMAKTSTYSTPSKRRLLKRRVILQATACLSIALIIGCTNQAQLIAQEQARSAEWDRVQAERAEEQRQQEKALEDTREGAAEQKYWLQMLIDAGNTGLNDQLTILCSSLESVVQIDASDPNWNDELDNALRGRCTPSRLQAADQVGSYILNQLVPDLKPLKNSSVLVAGYTEIGTELVNLHPACDELAAAEVQAQEQAAQEQQAEQIRLQEEALQQQQQALQQQVTEQRAIRQQMFRQEQQQQMQELQQQNQLQMQQSQEQMQQNQQRVYNNWLLQQLRNR